jgi:nucleoside-diphosphate-sugar epimerase
MRQIVNENVCVIGGAGFLGSHLVDYLVEERGCNVLVLDNLITGIPSYVNPKAKFEWFDIRGDENELAKILKKNNIKYMFNYAAEPYIPECFERPMHFFDINATSVLRVLNACQDAGVEAILQVSSAEIYGNMTGKIKESDPVEPHSTYGVSKAAADGLVQVRWKEAKVPAIAMRQFNCVGERETHEYVIPEIIAQLAESNTVRLGNNSFRDFQYAGDAVKMAVELLEKGEFGEVYNMGSEGGIKIYELAELIGKLIGHGSINIDVDQARVRPWEIWHLQSDNTKLYSVIDRRPEVDLEEALQRTIDFYYENNKKWDWKK